MCKIIFVPLVKSDSSSVAGLIVNSLPACDSQTKVSLSFFFEITVILSATKNPD
jgi:hypothetical protein